MPLMVVATMHAGLPSQATAASSAARTLAISCPSALKRLPAEGAELVRHGLDVVDVGHMAVDLQIVEVNDSNEVIELLVARKHRGLPVLALLHLAVTEEHKDAAGLGAVALSVEPEAERDTGADRKALAERTRADLHARAGVTVGVALQAAAHLTKRRDLVVRKVAELDEERVERRRRVTLGEDEAVTLGVIGVGRIHTEEAGVEERRHDIGRRERAARMAGARSPQHLDDVVPHAVGDERNLRVAPRAGLSQCICCHEHPSLG